MEIINEGYQENVCSFKVLIAVRVLGKNVISLQSNHRFCSVYTETENRIRDGWMVCNSKEKGVQNIQSGEKKTNPTPLMKWEEGKKRKLKRGESGFTFTFYTSSVFFFF